VDSHPTGGYLSFTLYVAKGKQASAFNGRLVFADGRQVQVERGSYTVRLWVEPNGGLARGTIRHAETGQLIHFQSSGRIAEFIRRGLTEPRGAAAAQLEPLHAEGAEPARSIVVDATILIPNGPEIALSRRVTVDAFDKRDVTVNAGAMDLEVELLSEAPPGQVQFLLVASDQYGEHLSYKVNDRASSEVYRLDQPHLLCFVQFCLRLMQIHQSQDR